MERKPIYVLFKKVCEIERNAMEAYKGSENKSKPKAIHTTQKNYCSSSDEEQEPRIHNTTRSNPNSKPWNPPSNRCSDEEQEPRIYNTTRSNPSPKPWNPPSNMKFPCPINGHKHEMTSCSEFFAMSPKERWSGIERRRFCYTCLKPKTVCKNNRCSFEKKVNKLLLCPGCEESAQRNNWSPLNILMCRRREHTALRAPFEEIKTAFKKYFETKLSTSIPDASIKYSVNFMNQIHTLSEKILIETEPAPCINSNTGERVEPNPENIIPEVREHSFYITQWLKIGKSKCLTFFDPGANTHLVDGALAKKENIQIISSRPSALKVVGGGRDSN